MLHIIRYDRPLKSTNQVHRLRIAQIDHDEIRQNILSKSINLALRHTGQECLRKCGDCLCRGVDIAQPVLQPVGVYVRVPIESGGVEFNLSHHGCSGIARLIFSPVALIIVHRGEEIRFGLDRLHADCVRHLSTGIHIQIRVIGNHAAEQRHVNGTVIGYNLLDALFVTFNRFGRILGVSRFDGNIRQLAILTIA